MERSRLCLLAAAILVTALFQSIAVAQDTVNASVSGSWFNPDRSGEGFVVQALEPAANSKGVAAPDRVLVTWFTFSPSGEQAWMIGVGTVTGDTIFVEDLRITRGGQFGPDFDPNDVVSDFWGTLTLIIETCRRASMSYSGPGDWGDGGYTVVRLSELAGLDCDEDGGSFASRSARSGPFFDPTHDGEGWMIEVLPDGRVVVYWFTYDDQGRQVWLVGNAELTGDTLWISEMVQPIGASFGDAFDSADIELVSWGEFGMLYDECEGMLLRYRSDLEVFGTGTLAPRALASLAGSGCEPPPALPLITGLWQPGPSLPDGFGSEGASALVGGEIYHTGGQPAGLAARRLVPGGNWEQLATLPGIRHHQMMTDLDGDLHLLGGYNAAIFTGPSPNNNHWRYDADSDSWEILGAMPSGTGAGSALVLNGRIHVMGGVPARHFAWDPRTEEWEILPQISFQTDHHKSVVYRGEIWMVGGRAPGGSNEVRIFSPVTQEWRDGPPMNEPHSAFGLVVIDDHVIVTGGEVLEPFPVMTPSTEIYSPSTNTWTIAPGAPIPVHGSDAVVVNNELWLMGGSAIPAQLDDIGMVQIWRPQ